MYSLKENEDTKQIEIQPAEACEEVEGLPDDIFTKPLSLSQGIIFSLQMYAVVQNFYWIMYYNSVFYSYFRD